MLVIIKFIIFNFVTHYFFNFIDSAVTIILFYFFTVFYNSLQIYFIPIVILDLLIYIYLIGRTMKMFLFIFSLSIWAGVFFMKHFQILTKFLKKTLVLVQNASLSKHAFSQRLYSFFTEHTKVSMLYNFTNIDVWHRISFICLGCQVPSNIYLVYRAIDPKLSGSKLIVTYLIMINQSVLIFIALMFLAKAAKVIPKGHKFIPKLQAYIPKNMILFKLKYMQLYERLNNKKKIGTAVGPFSTITFKMCFRVCLNVKKFLFKK